MLARLTQQAEGGDAAAVFHLGCCYRDGIGVVQSHEQAVTWFQRAAQLGDADAQVNLGVAYKQGRGVAQSWEEAVRL